MADAYASIKPRKRKRRLPQGLLRRKKAAAFCDISAPTWDRMTAAGLTPSPIKLGGSVMWGYRELSEWCQHHCPPRSEWSAIWPTIRDRRNKTR